MRSPNLLFAAHKTGDTMSRNATQSQRQMIRRFLVWKVSTDDPL